MAPKVTEDRIIEAMRRLKSTGLVAKEFGIAARSAEARVRRIEKVYGIKFERIRASAGSDIARNELARSAPQRQQFQQTPVFAPQDVAALDDRIAGMIRGRPRSIDDVASACKSSRRDVEAALSRLVAKHLNVHRVGETVSIERDPAPMQRSDELHTYNADRAGYYRFGVISDNHFGSRYCRLDVNDDLYDWFAEQGVQRVYNAGNYIEGEARFNRYELTHVGMAAQVEYFCERYPRRDGITTYFIAGDDHEGWYQQATGIKIGPYTETTAREQFGRTDLRYIGYVESFIELRHPSGAQTQMLVQHPGGGSAYAISYAAQKSVESAQGGEKPAVWIFGHWHKLFSLNIRNVICIGAGCTKDLDTFGRKQKLAYHIGGHIVELWQNGVTGAIERYRVETKHYFDRGYYNGQFDDVGTAEG